MQCQRCRLPLWPHESLGNLTKVQQNLLLKSGKHENGSPQTIRPPGKVPFKGNESFVMLTESIMNNAEDGSPQSPSQREVDRVGSRLAEEPSTIMAEPDHQLSKRVETLEALFDNLSANSDIDYPVCTDCSEMIRDSLRARYEEVCSERDVYISFLNKLKDQPGAGSEELEELSDEIRALEVENKEALEELKQAEAEREELEKELEKLKLESEELREEEEEFFKEQNEYALKLREQRNELDRVESIYTDHTVRLQRLQRINVYNDTFCIGHDGYFGTINGLRLGRLKDKKVEWPEINAAWGQTLLLLATVIQKLNFKLTGYRLRPLGSASRIEKLDPNNPTGRPISLELYSSGDHTFERLLKHKKLDAAMVAFLVILRQVGEYVESMDSSLRLPYKIEEDKIGGYSIKLSMSSSNESWTTACKYVLTNAKWILAYASSR
ncbi:vacuolar protein sorting-associated protein 30 [Trichomonascus vanleenenianus]|uniref:beclin 1 n=1 Tax=Trichomonascus vanleenenianus TaxID=2268995 RepID=UPI003EC987FC